MHYSLSTEKAYVYWIRFFVRWSGLRHPRDMGSAEVEAFLTMLASQRRVSSSTHKQALSAVLFLYRQALGLELPWMDSLQRPTERKYPDIGKTWGWFWVFPSPAPSTEGMRRRES